MNADGANIRRMNAFGLHALVEGGALRRITFAGTEVLRLIDYPIRDADWGTVPTTTTQETLSDGAYLRRFRTDDGAMEGRFQATVAPAGAGIRITAELDLAAMRDVTVNRAGFVVLHPLDGVAGQPLSVRRPDGRVEESRFPEHISAAQPVMNIASLTHRVGGVDVSIAFEGEIFEMEDQRNWTDASFKTYCRPLALPRPYTLRAGEEVSQKTTVTLTRTGLPLRPAAQVEAARTVIMPEIVLAHEHAFTGPVHPGILTIGASGILVRTDGRCEDGVSFAGLADLPVTLEIATGRDPVADIRAAGDAADRAGLNVVRVIALPSDYLASHQPQGPWPGGSTPADLVPMVRQAFPAAEAGGGMLTNFTEFNRCPPDPGAVDFTTFGTTAIVHAADDRSVIETLEAIAPVIESARTLSGMRPLRLGLMSIGMRSNPYGADVVPNPDGELRPMAMADPRQCRSFAAAFAIALAAACARGGVTSFAPAMTGGPLGMGDGHGPWPIWHAVAALAALSGRGVAVSGGQATGLVTIRGRGRRGIAGVVANLGPADALVEGNAIPIPDRAAENWIDVPDAGGPLTLAPMTAAIIKDEPA